MHDRVGLRRHRRRRGDLGHGGRLVRVEQQQRQRQPHPRALDRRQLVDQPQRLQHQRRRALGQRDRDRLQHARALVRWLVSRQLQRPRRVQLGQLGGDLATVEPGLIGCLGPGGKEHLLGHFELAIAVGWAPGRQRQPHVRRAGLRRRRRQPRAGRDIIVARQQHQPARRQALDHKPPVRAADRLGPAHAQDDHRHASHRLPGRVQHHAAHRRGQRLQHQVAEPCLARGQLLTVGRPAIARRLRRRQVVDPCGHADHLPGAGVLSRHLTDDRHAPAVDRLARNIDGRAGYRLAVGIDHAAAQCHARHVRHPELPARRRQVSDRHSAPRQLVAVLVGDHQLELPAARQRAQLEAAALVRADHRLHRRGGEVQLVIRARRLAGDHQVPRDVLRPLNVEDDRRRVLAGDDLDLPVRLVGHEPFVDALEEQPDPARPRAQDQLALVVSPQRAVQRHGVLGQVGDQAQIGDRRARARLEHAHGDQLARRDWQVRQGRGLARGQVAHLLRLHQGGRVRVVGADHQRLDAQPAQLVAAAGVGRVARH